MIGIYILVDLNFYLCNPAGYYSTVINQVLCNPFHLWRASSSLAPLVTDPRAQYHFPFSIIKEEGEKVCFPKILDNGSPSLLILQRSNYEVI